MFNLVQMCVCVLSVHANCVEGTFILLNKDDLFSLPKEKHD